MAKLHQLLAVESDLEGKYKRICEETRKTFGKDAMFTGSIRTMEPFQEGDVADPAQHQEMTTTVSDRLEYTGESIVNYFDALYQKEATNQIAKADLILQDDSEKVLIAGAPATFLLGLEARLKFLRSVYEAMPTLPAGIKWEPSADKGAGVFDRVPPEETLKTKKEVLHKVLVDATEHHPAQIDKWEEQVPVGKYIKNTWCSAVTSAQKADMLGRIDLLIKSVKFARQKANAVTVTKDKVSGAIVDFINTGKI